MPLKPRPGKIPKGPLRPITRQMINNIKRSQKGKQKIVVLGILHGKASLTEIEEILGCNPSAKIIVFEERKIPFSYERRRVTGGPGSKFVITKKYWDNGKKQWQVAQDIEIGF